jgi:acetyl-CoA C-acetyltransferase
MSKVSIIGAHNTKFGSFIEFNKETKERKDLKSYYELLIEAAQGAVKSSGLSPEEIDAIFIGSCSPSMFVNQEHVAPLGLEAFPKEWRFKPAFRLESACASSSAAVYSAVYGIESGRFKNVVVIGVEKMNLLGTKEMTHTLACSSYWPEEGAKGMSFPMLFAEYAKGYQKQYKLTDEKLREMLANVAANCYSNGIKNPLAHYGPGSFIEKTGLTTAKAIMDLPDEGKGANLMIAPPLRLHDCSLVSDGAAALVLTTTENAKKVSKKAVEIAGIGHTTERIAESVRPNMYELMAGKEAVKQSFKEAGVTINDVDFAEVHDCFTINQITSTEALGLAKDGQAGYDYINGKFKADDKCPVNLSGGLKAKGHPVGATGASMHALAYFQLIGEPIGVAPAKQPEVGVIFNVGGSAVTNCVTTMKRIK